MKDHGIEVNGPVPQRIPIITYPTFDANSDSLLKKHLSRDLWAQLKKKNTPKGGNIQMVVKSGVDRPQCEVGVLATDEESYKTFSDLFQPIVKDLHPRYDFRYTYKFEELQMEPFAQRIQQSLQLQEALTEKITHFKLTAKRNFRSSAFSPLMTREQKLQVERKVVEVLGELYGQYT